MGWVLGPKFESMFLYLVVSFTFENHIETLAQITDCLANAGLIINISKCEFYKLLLIYFSYVVEGWGLRTDPTKEETIVNFSTPLNDFWEYQASIIDVFQIFDACFSHSLNVLKQLKILLKI